MHSQHIQQGQDDLAFDVDLDRAVDDLRRESPGMCIWWGEYTGSLWALLPEGLIEAKNARDLAGRIQLVLGRRHSREPARHRVERRVPSARTSSNPPRAMPRRRRPPRRRVGLVDRIRHVVLASFA
ncbi:hypothetical protein ACFHW2_31515 [Actinomadura sp. LOL_016]|uniref:hypothetical protein n=1 Tax=unclassified Actinomadura TaxID=2626254 RepID=UPI003A813432